MRVGAELLAAQHALLIADRSAVREIRERPRDRRVAGDFLKPVDRAAEQIGVLIAEELADGVIGDADAARGGVVAR